MNTKKRQLVKPEDENRPPKKDTKGIVLQKANTQETIQNFQFSSFESTKTNFNFQPTSSTRGALGTININSQNPSLKKKETSQIPSKPQNVQTFIFNNGIKPLQNQTIQQKPVEKQEPKKITKDLFIFVDDEMDIVEKSGTNTNLLDTFENYSTNYEYSLIIFDHLKKTELNHKPDPKYLTTIQTEVNISMRSILIDWICEVVQEYKLLDETLFLSVNLVDRFLSKHATSRGKLQLIGVTCVFLSAKYFELVTPNVDDYVYITDNTYSKEMILSTEMHILNIINWNLGSVLSLDFLDRYLLAMKADAIYLAELTLQSYEMLEFSPSVISASCVVLSLHSLGFPHWNETIKHYSGYNGPELNRCLHKLFTLYQNASVATSLTATRTKYSSPHYGMVSTFKPPKIGPVLM